MTATIVNKIKLWWHCLTNVHQEFYGTWLNRQEQCQCYDCDYGACTWSKALLKVHKENMEKAKEGKGA